MQGFDVVVRVVRLALESTSPLRRGQHGRQDQRPRVDPAWSDGPPPSASMANANNTRDLRSGGGCGLRGCARQGNQATPHDSIHPATYQPQHASARPDECAGRPPTQAFPHPRPAESIDPHADRVRHPPSQPEQQRQDDDPRARRAPRHAVRSRRCATTARPPGSRPRDGPRLVHGLVDSGGGPASACPGGGVREQGVLGRRGRLAQSSVADSSSAGARPRATPIRGRLTTNTEYPTIVQVHSCRAATHQVPGDNTRRGFHELPHPGGHAHDDRGRPPRGQKVADDAAGGLGDHVGEETGQPEQHDEAPGREHRPQRPGAQTGQRKPSLVNPSSGVVFGKTTAQQGIRAGEALLDPTSPQCAERKAPAEARASRRRPKPACRTR